MSGIYQTVIFEESYRREGEQLLGQWTFSCAFAYASFLQK
jgi:hypothetical protein